MPPEDAGQLVKFVYKAFGGQCAALLLAGYGEEPVRGAKKLYVHEFEAEQAQEWEIEIVTAAPPYLLPGDSEPLVLAVLLKMLVGRAGMPSPLEFQMSEVVGELRQVGVTLKPQSIDQIIVKYVALSYHKRPWYGDASDEGGGGVYSLISGYVRDNAGDTDGAGPRRVFSSVQFDPRFVAALRDDEIIFAGIRFGRLGQTAA